MKFFQKHRRQLVAAMAIFLAMLILLPMITMVIRSAGAVTQAEIDALKEDAEALARQKEDLNQELSALEGQIDSAYAQKLVVEQEIDVTARQIAATEDLIVQYDGLIAQEEANLADAEARQAQYYDECCQRVRVMEEQGSVTYWHILFNAADFSDLLDRAMMVSETVEYDNAILNALEQARRDVETAKAALETARAGQVEAKAALVEQKAELDAQNASYQALIAELEARQDVYEQELSDLDNEESEIEDEIARAQAELERQLAAAAAAAAAANGSGSSASSAIQYNTGSGYLWPLDGYYTLSSLFGARPHPLTGKPDNHRGIDIPAPSGTPIKAARGGYVITSGYNSSYGNYVVVSHSSSGDSTLYAHMSKRAVSVGEQVSQGQVIGYVGTTGSSNGNHLHFEVRVGGNRTDPVTYYPGLSLWVRDNGQTVSLPH